MFEWSLLCALALVVHVWRVGRTVVTFGSPCMVRVACRMPSQRDGGHLAFGSELILHRRRNDVDDYRLSPRDISLVETVVCCRA